MLTVLRRRWVMFALAAVLAGCGARSINDVLADPTRYRNTEITVRGTVAESASLLGRGAYRITDGGQGLWVITTGGAPRSGARVNVKGRLQEGYDLSGLGKILKLPESLQSGVVLIERSHEAR